MKKAKKMLDLTKGIIGTSIISQSLGTIGGTVAEKGQKVMSNISVFYPAMGTTIGSGMVIGSLEELIKVGKIKARRKRK